MITTILIDDEDHNRSVLKTLLEKHCPEVKFLGEYSNANDAFLKIKQLKPELIFLDIKMPNKDGFELLKMFDKINFEVIFVSAFDQYAVTAFEFNALGYILKPIDYEKLIKAVDKVKSKLKTSEPDKISHFIKSFDEKNEFLSRISFHHGDKVALADIEDIEFIEAKIDYCEIYMENNLKYLSSKDLKSFEEVLSKSKQFLRISKSVIINLRFIKNYTKGEQCIIQLKSGSQFEVSRRKKTEILNILSVTI